MLDKRFIEVKKGSRYIAPGVSLDTQIWEVHGLKVGIEYNPYSGCTAIYGVTPRGMLESMGGVWDRVKQDWRFEPIKQELADAAHRFLYSYFGNILELSTLGQTFENPFTRTDYETLKKLVWKDYLKLARRNPLYLEQELIGITLGQGAANHLTDGNNGFKDFDVWMFFKQSDQLNMPHRRVSRFDSGLAHFGPACDMGPNFVGRRVDVMIRAIPLVYGDSGRNIKDVTVNSIRNYIKTGSSMTPKLLSKKSMFMMHPFPGRPVWDYQKDSR